MKKYLIFSLLVFFTLGRSFAQDVPPQPNPPRLVNDFAKQLNASEVDQLERKLVSYNDSTSSDITIVVIPTTGDYAIADYALKIGREWKVGQVGKNNGIVILWASTDRKIFISVGDGMEGAIPDAIAKRIISQIITPEFKNGMYYQGLDKGVDALFKYATGEYKADPKDDQGDGKSSPLLIFIIVFAVIIFLIYRSRNNGKGGGGIGNFGGPIIWPYTTFSGRGGSSGSWGGGGSSWGGGDGGGFGGFGGGGGFSGGGAGGDY